MGTSRSTYKQPQGPNIRDELGNVLLLIVLYMVQGIPLGLSMGSMPFLMRSTMSYTKIGIFTLAAYPYSFKLLWSPLVDTIYSRRVGRRKSWILPLQTISAAVMIFYGGWVESRLHAADAVGVTALFFVLVLLAATQDIAVDGWALTLLSKNNVGYAATCQTVGMNIGYFTSFTVFLALSDPGFCSSYLGTPDGVPVVTLSGYMQFWGYVYLLVTAAVAVFKPEGRKMVRSSSLKSSAPKQQKENGQHNTTSLVDDSDIAVGGDVIPTPVRRRSLRLAALSTSADEPAQTPALENSENGHGRGGHGKDSGWIRSPEGSFELHGTGNDEDNEIDGHEEEEDLREAYAQLWRVVNLPSVRLLAVMLMVARLGMLAAESAAPLKLLEKGVSKEALAGLVLVEFPVELVSALIAGRWAASSHPLRPYFGGYKLRLALAAGTTTAVYYFPANAASLKDAPFAFGILAALGVATSFSSTLMFTALGDFFNRVSDPTMGGAYLTLLNTLANVGVVVPKLAVFAAMDFLTARRCSGSSREGGSVEWLEAACGPASAGGSADGACTDAGGSCVVVRDGFYVLVAASAVLGTGIGVWMQRALKKLEAADPSAWRAPVLVTKSPSKEK